MDFRFLDFKRNILKEVIENNKQEKTLFVFPTRASQKQSLKYYQDHLDFNGSSFLTMDEWKEIIFTSVKPLLKEEKRSLALYSSLSEGLKEKYRIKNYFGFSGFASGFFKFWEELNEEMVSDADLLSVISRNQLLSDWQQDMIRDYIQIKENYRSWLGKWNYSDPVFTRIPDQIDISSFNGFKKIVIVNQYYYTRLERKIIELLSEKTIIYYQLPDEAVDRDDLKPRKDLDYAGLLRSGSLNVKILQAPDETSMICHFLNRANSFQPDIVVDFRTENKPYSRFISPREISGSRYVRFPNSSVYRLISTLLNLLSSRIRTDDHPQALFGIQEMIDLIQTDEFLLVAGWEEAQITQIRADFLKYLYELFEEDYKYIDLEGDLLDLKPPAGRVKSLLLSIFSLVKEITARSGSLHDFCDLFSSSELISPLKFLTEAEKNSSNLIEEFYKILADLQSLEELNFPLDLSDLVQSDLSLSALNRTGIYLRLLADHLRSRYFSFNLRTAAGKFGISSLQNTRDLSYEKVIILNLVEGVLPANPKPSHLLTENQRKELGLKTYEDIKAREKYYFYRLLLQSSESLVFTYSQPEKNNFISSYLEEIRLALPEHTIFSEVREFDMQSLYRKFTGTGNTDWSPGSSAIGKSEFFSIPLDRSADFPQKEIDLTYYSWQELKRNPFLFYLMRIAGFEPRTIRPEQDFSAKLIGNIAHSILQEAVSRINDIRNDSGMHQAIIQTEEQLDAIIDDILIRERVFSFRRPSAYSRRYLVNIFRPVLRSGLSFFLSYLDQKYSPEKHRTVKLIPEGHSRSIRSMLFADKAVTPLPVYLKGRADLRIQLDDRELIMDYKTGSSLQWKKYIEQLLFYELIYCLLDKPERLAQVDSCLYYIEDQFFKYQDKSGPNKSVLIEKLKSEIADAVKGIFETGYTVSEKHDPYDMTDISRRDLLKTGKKD